VPANEFYNLQGRKFSTSANWTIPLEEFFARYDRDATRFYLLSSVPEAADSEWRWEEYQRAVNALADSIGNLATRVLRFVVKHHAGRVPPLAPAHAAELERALLAECGPIADPAESILGFRFRRATEELIANATVGNVFVDRLAPWALAKTDPTRSASVLHAAVQWTAWLARWMSPILPEKAQALWSMVGGQGEVVRLAWPGKPAPGAWRLVSEGAALGEVRALFQKIPDEEIAREIAALEARAKPA